MFILIRNYVLSFPATILTTTVNSNTSSADATIFICSTTSTTAAMLCCICCWFLRELIWKLGCILVKNNVRSSRESDKDTRLILQSMRHSEKLISAPIILKMYSENVARLFRSLSRDTVVNFRTQIILDGTTNKMDLHIFMEIRKRQMSEEK